MLALQCHSPCGWPCLRSEKGNCWSCGQYYDRRMEHGSISGRRDVPGTDHEFPDVYFRHIIHLCEVESDWNNPFALIESQGFSCITGRTLPFFSARCSISLVCLSTYSRQLLYLEKFANLIWWSLRSSGVIRCQPTVLSWLQLQHQRWAKSDEMVSAIMLIITMMVMRGFIACSLFRCIGVYKWRKLINSLYFFYQRRVCVFLSSADPSNDLVLCQQFVSQFSPYTLFARSTHTISICCANTHST